MPPVQARFPLESLTDGGIIKVRKDAGRSDVAAFVPGLLCDRPEEPVDLGVDGWGLGGLGQLHKLIKHQLVGRERRTIHSMKELGPVLDRLSHLIAVLPDQADALAQLRVGDAC